MGEKASPLGEDFSLIFAKGFEEPSRFGMVVDFCASPWTNPERNAHVPGALEIPDPHPGRNRVGWPIAFLTEDR
jgi:hypothetical protein